MLSFQFFLSDISMYRTNHIKATTERMANKTSKNVSNPPVKIPSYAVKTIFFPSDFLTVIFFML